MTDNALGLLLQQAIDRENGDKNILWLADENLTGEALPKISTSWHPRVISNRINITQQFSLLGYAADFSDFDLSAIDDNSIDCILYRISKEKPVVHYLINQSHRLLKNGGQLILAGDKKEGIKTYIEKAQTLLGAEAKIYKHKPLSFCAMLSKTTNTTACYLDDKDYCQLRPIGSQEPFTFYSKPGIFGWNKIDKGSAFLIDHLDDFLATLEQKNSLLDLGCGYGYIAMMASLANFDSICASDNNAAALLACQYNFTAHNIKAEVLAGDCADTISQEFDVILCNPPFHQGFSLDNSLTERFLKTTRRLLSPKGSALFVVNAFIPLERKASSYFKEVKVLANNRSFKLISLKS